MKGVGKSVMFGNPLMPLPLQSIVWSNQEETPHARLFPWEHKQNRQYIQFWLVWELPEGLASVLGNSEP